MKILFAVVLSFGFFKAYGHIEEKRNLTETENHQLTGGNDFLSHPLLVQNPTVLTGNSVTNSSSPPRELTWDMVDRLLTAESAIQDNDLNFALEKYMEMGRETGDSSISARAVEIALLMKTTNSEDKVAEATQLHSEADHSNIKASMLLSPLLVQSGNIDGAVDHFKLIIERMSNKSIAATEKKQKPDLIPLPDLEKKINGFKENIPSFDNVIGLGFNFAIDTLSKFIREEQEETALSTMKQLAGEYEQENVEAQMALALLFAKAEKIDEALSAVETIAPFSFGNTEIVIFQSHLFQENKEDQKAVDILEKFLRHYPNSEKIRRVYVSTLTGMGEYEKAVNEYKELLRRYPKDDKVRYFFSMTLWYVDQLDEAKQQFEKLLESDTPLIADLANYSLGQIAETKKQYNEATTFYKNVTTNQTYFFNAQVKIAEINAKKGNLRAALNQLHSLQPSNPEQFIMLLNAEADMLIDTGHYEEMKANYKQILQIQPSNFFIIESYIRSADKIGQIDMDFVENHFKMLLNSNPNDAATLNYLGYLLAEYTDRYEESYHILSWALQIEPNNPHITDSVGWALFRLKRYQEALEHLEKAKSLFFPQVSAEIEAHIGELHWTLGNKEEARKIWNKALNRKLSDEEYLVKTMQRLDPNGQDDVLQVP